MYVWLPAGPVQTWATLRQMRRLVNRALRSPIVVETAGRVVAGIDGRDRISQIAAIDQWVRSRLHFLADPYGVELLRSPEWMLARIAREGTIGADCDDGAILVAALGKGIGLRARFRASAFDRAGPYRHVFAELASERGWVPLDVTSSPGEWVAPVREMVQEV